MKSRAPIDLPLGKNRHIKLPYPTFVPVKDVEYPTVIQMPPQEADPFLYPDLPLYQPGDN